MLHKLLIYLHTNLLVDWVYATEDNTVIKVGYQQPISEIPSFSENKRVVVVVPSTSILLTKAKLPKTQRAQLLRAVPYAIEEQLAEDIEDLHFAIGAWQKDNTLPVVVASRAVMQAWLDSCKSINLQPDVMIPDVLVTAHQDNAWVCTLLDKIALIRTETFSGFAVDKDNLEIALQDLPALEAGQSLQINNYTEDKNILAAFSKLKDIELQINKKEKTFLIDILPYIHNKSFNLLQGQFKSAKSGLAYIPKYWQLTLGLAIGLLAALAMTQLAEFIFLDIHYKTLQKEMAAIYEKIFPGQLPTDLATTRVESQLQKLTLEATGNPFLIHLGKIAQIISTHKNLQIEMLTYEKNYFIVRIAGADTNSMNDLKNQLKQEGLEATIKNLPADKNSSKPRIELSVKEI